MLKNKIIISSIAIVGIVAGSIFYACKKDNNELLTNDTKAKVAKTGSLENPYDFVGQLHNKALDYIAETCDLNTLRGIDVNNAVNDFMQNHFADYESTPYDEFVQHLERTDELTAALYTGEMRMGDFWAESGAADAGNVLDRLTSLFKNMNATNHLMYPDEFASQVAIFENEVLCWNKHNNPDETPILNAYSMALATMAVAKYSYEYWYNAKVNPDHPWHIVIPDDDGDEPLVMGKFGDFFKKVWNAICQAGNAIEKVFSAASVDIGGGLERGFTSDPDIWVPNFDISIRGFVAGAADASGSYWAGN